MTEARVGYAQLPEFSMARRLDIHELGLNASGEAIVQRFENPAENLEQAAEIFGRDGAVILAPNCEITLPNGEQITIGQMAGDAQVNTVQRLQDIWSSDRREEVIRKKHYDAYNGTQRDMRTVSYKNVLELFPEVIDLQHDLLPTIREIVQDPTTEISTDADEGTVINLQLFDPNAPEDTRQEHGAHTDRVDTTAVICLDNVGPQGDFIYAKGYNDACRNLGLDPHRNFTANIEQVLRETPEAITLRIYPVQPGTLAVIRTDQDVHFITAKSKHDVSVGKETHEPLQIGGQWLGRGIINAAFETRQCRDIDSLARHIEEEHNLASLRGDEFFDKLDDVLRTADLTSEESDLVRNAAVTRMSADQLYNDI